MIRLIAIFTMILMPIISVSTGTTDSESVLRARDEVDEGGCTIAHGCPKDGGINPFAAGSVSANR